MSLNSLQSELESMERAALLEHIFALSAEIRRMRFEPSAQDLLRAFEEAFGEETECLMKMRALITEEVANRSIDVGASQGNEAPAASRRHQPAPL